MNAIEITDLLPGDVITNMVVDVAGDKIIIDRQGGDKFQIYHDNDCCERVGIDKVEGNVSDIIGFPLTSVSESHPELPAKEHPDSSFTWTVYEFNTIEGCYKVFWYGESNGHYCETPSIYKGK